MILSEVKIYLQENHVTNMFNLIHHFKTDPETMRGMLGHWIRKGKIRKLEPSLNKCEKCQQCDPLIMEIYEWVIEEK